MALAALGLLVLGAYGLLAVLALWAGLRTHPHLVTPDGLVLRAGPHTGVRVPWPLVADVRREVRHASTARLLRGTLHLPVDGTTTWFVELREPVLARQWLRRPRLVTGVAGGADDPRTFLRAARARLARPPGTAPRC